MVRTIEDDDTSSDDELDREGKQANPLEREIEDDDSERDEMEVIDLLDSQQEDWMEEETPNTEEEEEDEDMDNIKEEQRRMATMAGPPTEEDLSEDEWEGWNLDQWTDTNPGHRNQNTMLEDGEQTNNNRKLPTRIAAWNTMQKFDKDIMEEVMTIGEISAMGIYEPIPSNATEYSKEFYRRTKAGMNQMGIEAIMEDHAAFLIDNLKLHYSIEKQKALLQGRIITTELKMKDGHQMGIISIYSVAQGGNKTYKDGNDRDELRHKVEKKIEEEIARLTSKRGERTIVVMGDLQKSMSVKEYAERIQSPDRRKRNNILDTLIALGYRSPHLQDLVLRNRGKTENDPGYQEYHTRWPMGESQKDQHPTGIDYIWINEEGMERLVGSNIDREVTKTMLKSDHAMLTVDLDLERREGKLDEQQHIKVKYMDICRIPIRKGDKKKEEQRYEIAENLEDKVDEPEDDKRGMGDTTKRRSKREMQWEAKGHTSRSADATGGHDTEHARRRLEL